MKQTFNIITTLFLNYLIYSLLNILLLLIFFIKIPTLLIVVLITVTTYIEVNYGNK